MNIYFKNMDSRNMWILIEYNKWKMNLINILSEKWI